MLLVPLGQLQAQTSACLFGYRWE